MMRLLLSFILGNTFRYTFTFFISTTLFSKSGTICCINLALHHGHAMDSAKQTALFPLQLQGKDSAESHRRTKLSSASPIYSMQIKISADVLSPVRKNGQFTVFEDKVNISFTNEPDASFDLHDPFIKVIPDLDLSLIHI